MPAPSLPAYTAPRLTSYGAIQPTPAVASERWARIHRVWAAHDRAKAAADSDICNHCGSCGCQYCREEYHR